MAKLRGGDLHAHPLNRDLPRGRQRAFSLPAAALLVALKLRIGLRPLRFAQLRAPDRLRAGTHQPKLSKALKFAAIAAIQQLITHFLNLALYGSMKSSLKSSFRFRWKGYKWSE